jgi:hypothetical protein
VVEPEVNLQHTKQNKNTKFVLDMMANIYNPSTSEAEAGIWRV